MNKNNYFLLMLIPFFTNAAFSQVGVKYKENAAIQKTLVLDTSLPAGEAIQQFSKLYGLDEESTFESKKATSDDSGLTHQRYQQFYKGLKVEFGTVITHSRDGKITAINGELYNPSRLNLVPGLTAQQGFDLVLTKIQAQKYLWEDEAQANVMDYVKPKGELVIFPKILTGEIRLAYKYDVYALQPVSREEIFIDAHSGEVLYRNPIIKHANGLVSPKQIENTAKTFDLLVAGTAATRYSGSRSIETSFNAGLNKYVLLDNTRGNGIVTYNSERTNTYPSTHFQDNDNDWTTAEFANANKDNAALDAHWGAEKTYDFWKNVFNRNSYNDANAQIKSYVHYDDTPGGAGYSNAFWNGNVMTYGDGSTKPFTALDVCGHEIGHAVCTYTAGLAYQNQSGAMNEGFSDIWGACIEHYGRTGAMTGTLAAGIWIIGEDITTSGLRSMSNPNSKGDPDCIGSPEWIPTGDEGSCSPTNGNDHCGVHTNSNVLNYWFYLLTVGGSGTNNAPIAERDTYNVSGIGLTKASQIAYFTERDYLTPNSTYMDARIGSLAVANSLYCASSPEVIAVTNAWAAVNVGDAYVGQTNDVALKTIAGSTNVTCGTNYTTSIVFENAGSAAISSVTVSYTIDGGPAVNSVWNGSLSNCSTQAYPLSIGILPRGAHQLAITTTITNDGNPENNTKSIVILADDAGTVNSVNTFEAPSDILIAVDASGEFSSVWERGTSNKAQLSNAVAGNSKVYATNLNGTYPDKTKSYLISQCYDLTGIQNPVLKFDMAFDLENNWDILYMEYSTNGGTSWNVLGTSTDPNWYTSNRLPNGTNCFNCIGKQWTGDFAGVHPAGGTNGTKRQYSYNLANFGFGGAAPQSSMIFRFVFLSDDATTQDGAIIDNFVIDGTLSRPENEFDNFNVFPNPSNGLFTLVLSTSESVNIALHDLRGRSVYTKSFASNGSVFNKELDFSTLSSGVYLLIVESAGRKASKKIIIN